MKTSEAFPSNFIKSDDLRGREVTLRITGCKLVDLGDDTKPVLSFAGTEKEFVCNRTNFFTIADLYGDETDDWCGQRITLRTETTMYQGKRVPCLRVKPEVPPKTNGQSKPAAAPPPPKPAPVVAPVQHDAYEDPTPDDDDIPF